MGANMKVKLLTVCILALVVSGCISAHQRQYSFVESEYKPYAKTGAAYIRGEVLLEDRETKVILPESYTKVAAIPVTNYTKEDIEVTLYRGKRITPTADKRLQNYIKTVETDKTGNFEFRYMPPGDYFIAAKASWYIGNKKVYGAIVKRVAVNKNQHNVYAKLIKRNVNVVSSNARAAFNANVGSDEPDTIKSEVKPQTKENLVEKHQDVATGKYSGNVKSYVFHRPGCQYYACKNCTIRFSTRDEAISAGYKPCSKCKP